MAGVVDALNDAVQRSTDRREARAALEGVPLEVLAGVADLNYLDTEGRRDALVLRIVEDVHPRVVTSVRSSFGHRFHESSPCDDDSTYETCLTCGARFVLLNVGHGRGEYQASNGDTPNECSGDTGMAHGYPGERVCQSTNDGRGCEGETCPHVDHDCNCVCCC